MDGRTLTALKTGLSRWGRSHYKVLRPVVQRGTGPELLSKAGFTIWAAQCARGQDGLPFPCQLSGTSRRPSGPGQRSRASCLLTGWLVQCFLCPHRQGEEGDRLERPAHHQAGEVGQGACPCPLCTLRLCPPPPGVEGVMVEDFFFPGACPGSWRPWLKIEYLELYCCKGVILAYPN